MRKLLAILFLFSFVNANATQRFLTNQGWGGAYYIANVNFTVNPGDTLLFRDADANGSMALEGFHGTLANPIVIMNYDLPYSNLPAFALHGCSYIKVTKAVGSDTYGLHSTGVSVGVQIDGQSHHIEVEYCKFYLNTYIGWIKQEASCYDSLNYPNRIYNISWHDTYATRITQDGMYFGSTAPNGGRPNGCGQSPIPMRLAYISYYNNYIDSCGRTGAQFSGVDSGTSYVYNNTIRNTGYEYNQTQGSGIILGGDTRNTEVYNNTIRATYQYGILSLGTSNNYIHNNNIDSSARIPIKDGGDSSINSTPLVKDLAAGVNINDIYIQIDGTKVSGTPAGIAYVVAAADGSSTYTAVSDTFTITNVASQTKTWHINAYSKRYWRVRIEGTGTQTTTWREEVLNPGYDFSIAASCADTYPANDSASITIQNNICDNSDAYNIIVGGVVDLWKRSGNYICTNTKQNGTSATFTTNAVSFIYSTICGYVDPNRWHKPANSRVIIQHQ